MKDKLALIYCSASFDIDPKFNEEARHAVMALADKGYGIVSGGTIKGTMKVVADAANECGVTNKGVIPTFMKGLEYPALTEIIWTETMSERKELMREGVSLAVALPGGIGTLDELMETLTLSKLKRFEGKIAALNLDGFYEPLKQLLDHYVNTGMLDSESRQLISFPESVEELIELV